VTFSSYSSSIFRPPDGKTISRDVAAVEVEVERFELTLRLVRALTQAQQISLGVQTSYGEATSKQIAEKIMMKVIKATTQMFPKLLNFRNIVG
jgi:hypothetical protein